jgi:hypothetical protein
MLTVLARLKLWKAKNYSSVLLSRFSGTPYTGTPQQNRSDKMHR